MKTENTCVNCTVLECHVRSTCEDNELPIGPQQPEMEDEDLQEVVQTVVPKLAKKVADEKRFW